MPKHKLIIDDDYVTPNESVDDKESGDEARHVNKKNKTFQSTETQTRIDEPLSNDTIQQTLVDPIGELKSTIEKIEKKARLRANKKKVEVIIEFLDKNNKDIALLNKALEKSDKDVLYRLYILL